VLSKQDILDSHSYHQRLNIVDRDRTIAKADRDRESILDRTHHTSKNSGVAVLARPHLTVAAHLEQQPFESHRTNLGSLQIVTLEWKSTFKLEYCPIVADYAICLPLYGCSDRSDRVSPVPTATVIDPSRSFAGIAGAAGCIAFIGIDRETIEHELAKLLDRALKQPLLFEPTIDLRTDFGMSLKELIEFVGRQRDPALNISSRLMQGELAGALLACLLKGVKNNYSDEILYHSHGAFACYVNKAIAFIESHLQDEIDLADIAGAVNISPRLLQKAFAQQYDCSPMRFVTRSRMQRIRQELERASGDTRIVDVMMDYGITQGGKFAKEYQQLFGEKPSDTLKRANQTDRQHHQLWQELDDFRSEQIVGGVAPTARRNLALPIDNFTLPPCWGDPAIWGGYLRVMGIHLSNQLRPSAVDRPIDYLEIN
jgi:AraC-like DNA-binding protein